MGKIIFKTTTTAATSIWWLEARDTANLPTKPRTTPSPKRLIQSKMLIVSRLRNCNLNVEAKPGEYLHNLGGWQDLMNKSQYT